MYGFRSLFPLLFRSRFPILFRFSFVRLCLFLGSLRFVSLGLRFRIWLFLGSFHFRWVSMFPCLACRWREPFPCLARRGREHFIVYGLSWEEALVEGAGIRRPAVCFAVVCFYRLLCSFVFVSFLGPIFRVSYVSVVRFGSVFVFISLWWGRCSSACGTYLFPALFFVLPSVFVVSSSLEYRFFVVWVSFLASGV
jgi:hypothetical protein